MWAKVRRTGLLYSLGIVINRIVPCWLFRFRQFVVYQMDETKFGDEANAQLPIKISWCVGDHEVQEVQKLTYTCAENLHHNHKAAQAKSGQQLAAALWAVKHHFTEDDLGIRYELNPNQIWLFAALVDAKFRQQGVYTKVLGFVCRRCDAAFVACPDDTADGSYDLLLCVNPHNIASNKVHQKYAKANLGQAISFRLLNVAVCLCFGAHLSADSKITWDAKNQPILIRLRSL